mmetsp:Transcript_49226/g.73221  ORF Transcript_49226/g.73221 Transcript_49226/m.73221 type:complete len:308 (+) Transcript_49226:87-1010(+)|eukprot:CAMPEP_0195517682 /NCGR_PEP_ID=MMETSP0794_2-20130614/11284_1 /TAXON_ID=515487 /ORGANISM="Stephanopyxis turris, Strain CCMP 815" /LENGTH=307 /DNA_ID=CAMNT_0040646533 /DNA_START=87 /DNA_END=1010 /DNA_ORIENTATION=+
MSPLRRVLASCLTLASLTTVSCESSIPSSPSVATPPAVNPSTSRDFAGLCEGVKCGIVENANRQVSELRAKMAESGTCIPAFGVVADEICNKALEEFASSAPDAGDSSEDAATYENKLEELERAVDAPLQVLYLRQLALIREKALQKYKAASRTSEASDYEAMLSADSQFVSEAEDATREGSDWEFGQERTNLQTVMSDLASSGKKVTDIQIKSAQQQSTAMQYLQQQQQMIQQLQMQLYGQTSPWNVGVAYRIPETNFNLQGSYQQGRTNVQLSCVPDEYASMLGPNGFTQGVGPGNLGLSLNLSI